MRRNDFDKQLIDKFEKKNFAYDAESWNKLSEHLPVTSKTKKILPFSIGIAAAILLLLATSIFILPWNKKADTALSEKSDKSLPEWEKSNPASQQNPENNNNEVTPTQPDQPSPPSIAVLKQKEDHKYDNNLKSGIEENTKDPQKEASLEKKIKDTKETIARPIEKEHDLNEFDQAFKSDYQIYNSKTIIGVGGGVNYGTLNTGYVLNLNAKRHLNRHVFVEGSFGIALNNNTYNVVETPEGSGFASRPSDQMAVKSPEIAPAQHLYYMQFNPSVGYQLDDKIALSIGTDFQRMLNVEEKATVLLNASNNGDAYLFPKMDVGATAKTEFIITPSINAGIIYREGLNNLLRSGSTINYVNRRYLQVQFKYNIPIKQ